MDTALTGRSSTGPSRNGRPPRCENSPVMTYTVLHAEATTGTTTDLLTLTQAH